MNDQESPQKAGFPALDELFRLLEGLERQKEELGPIAEELIELLHRLGVVTPPQGDAHGNQAGFLH